MNHGVRIRTSLTLYTSAADIQSHRVRLVLATKGVHYERVIVSPGQPPDDLLTLNPYGDIPTLVDRDLIAHDTPVLCEYIDERYPYPPLMPLDPLSRVRLRLAATRIERDWLPEVTRIQAGGTSAETARKRLREHLLMAQPMFRASRFFLNPEMSLLDCLVVPVIWRLPWLGVNLGREGKSVMDYGERLFQFQGYASSMTPEEKVMR